MSANSVLSVLAGGSLRCAWYAASTSPVRASATSQDRAESSGTSGAPACGRTWMPGRWSSAGPGGVAVVAAPDTPESVPVLAAAAAGMRARAPAAQSAPAHMTGREGNPIFM